MKDKLSYFIDKANTSTITISHKGLKDVVFLATKATLDTRVDVLEDRLALVGYWINIATERPYLVNSDSIGIKLADVDNWFEIEDPRN